MTRGTRQPALLPAQVQGLLPQVVHTPSLFVQPHWPKRVHRPHWQGGSDGFGPQGALELHAGVPSDAQLQPQPRLQACHAPQERELH